MFFFEFDKKKPQQHILWWTVDLIITQNLKPLLDSKKDHPQMKIIIN